MPQLWTRTPGFWKNRPALADSVLGGGLMVCGVLITNALPNEPDSVVEAMCVSPEGDSRLQLARQLMAAALNGAAGGGQFPDLAPCNAICANPNADADAVQDCIDDADDFNNAGDALGLPFSPGSANTNPCRRAHRSDCTILDPGAC
jgi:hypothetical protein